MPEAVKDRPTKSHELIFLLTKSEEYFDDADAMAEPCQQPGRTRMGKTKEQGVNGISDSSSIAVLEIRLQCPAPLSGFPL
jgi:hypothetical protein